jgi:anti-sigma B factor antagonist
MAQKEGEPVKVFLDEQAKATIIALDGSIDGKTAPLVRDELRPVLENASNAILDMTAVNYLSSAGLRLLLLVYREFAAKNGKLVLVGLSPEIQSVMSHTGFLSFFTVAATLAEAMRAFA